MIFTDMCKAKLMICKVQIFFKWIAKAVQYLHTFPLKHKSSNDSYPSSESESERLCLV